ncbi:MAG: chemotaxis protein CheC, partial [Methylocella sp.]
MTESPHAALDELELDALTELVNLGVGHAASNLRDMIGQQVFLSVPSVALIARQRAIDLLQTSEPRKLVAVHQMFEG